MSGKTVTLKRKKSGKFLQKKPLTRSGRKNISFFLIKLIENVEDHKDFANLRPKLFLYP